MSVDIGIAPQIAGVYDDGHEAGAVRTKPVGSNLVMVPFRLGNYEHLSGTVTDQGGIIAENEDGSGNATVVTTTPAGTYAHMRFFVYGRTFGVRFRRGFGIAGSNLPRDFTCLIDGVAYNVPNTVTEPRAQIGWNPNIFTDGWSRVLVAEDLPEYGDKPHLVELIFTPDPTLTSQWYLYGYVAEARAGYTPYPRGVSVAGTSVLTNAAAFLIYPTNQWSWPRGLRGVLYYNFTAGPVTVFVQFNGTTIWSKPIPANDTLAFDDLGLLANNSTNLKHYASAAASIQATLLGGL